MNADGAVKHGFGGTGFHGHGKALHHLARIWPHHVQAHHAVGVVVDQQLHQRALGATAQRVFERLEVCAVDADLVELVSRLAF